MARTPADTPPSRAGAGRTRPAARAAAPAEVNPDRLARLEEVRAQRAAERLAERALTRSKIEEDRARLRAESEARAAARREAALAEKARKEAEAQARKEAAEAARKQAEAEAQARKEAEAAEKARKEAAEKARKEAEAAEKARAEAEAARREAARRLPSPAAAPEGAATPVPAPDAARPGAAPPAPVPVPPPPGQAPALPSLARSVLPARPAGRAPALPPPGGPGAEALAGFALPPARPRRRHWGMLAGFLLLVLLPFLASGLYLWRVAQDQYASTVAFSVRKEEMQSSLDIIGGMTRLAGSTTSDSDILYEFIRSQALVERIAAQLDLAAIWARAWPEDPVFAYDPAGTIEDLHAHWLRMVRLSYDAGTGIITLRANAFDATEARAIAQAVFDESSRMINALSEEARADATRYAAEERDRAFERLATARQALTAFRLRTQIVDIGSDLQGQMGILTTLQAQLAEVLIELDLLRETAQASDPRIRQAERRIEVIEARIAAERAKFGEGGQGPGGEDYARIAAEFERLTVEREFAEATYRSALAAYDAAVSEAQRQSRYLAAHIRPTLAEQALYPQRWLLFGLSGFFLVMFWGVGVLVYYSVRDRR